MAGKFFKVPFAATGDKTTTPDAVQSDGSVSYSEGFGFDYERPNSDPEYRPVPRDGMNGLFYDVTEAIGIIQRQGVADWTAAAAPYAIKSIVRHNNAVWVSAVANNSATPGANANWASLPSSSDFGALAFKGSVDNTDWSGTELSVANGGTGAKTAATARANLGLGTLSTQSTISNANWSGTDLSVSNGGTGASDAATARINLGAAPLESPAFTGTPTAPTAKTGTNTTQVATTAFVQNTVAAVSSGVTNVSGQAPIVITGSTGTPVVTVSSATETAPGVVELATQAEAEAGTSNTVVPTTLRVAQAITAQALKKANNLSDVSNAATARANLGLGTLSTQSTISNANWSGTDLSVSNGGTGASDAATARINLGLGTAATGTVTMSDADTTPDRLLKVGDFGVGSTVNGTGDVNSALNDIAATSFFASRGTTAPDWDSGRLGEYPMGIHLQRSPLTRAQLAMGRNGTIAWRSGGLNLGAWKELFHTGNLTVSPLGKGLLATTDGAQARATLGAVSSADVDAKFTGANTLKAGAGYQRLPGGLIIQWGIASVPSDGTAAVTWPIAFPNAALQAVASQGVVISFTTDSSVSIYGLTQSGCTIANGLGTGQGSSSIRWISIGY